MDSQVLEMMQRQLNRRIARALSCSPYYSFFNEVRLLVEWVDGHPLLGAIIRTLELQWRTYREHLDTVSTGFAEGRTPLTEQTFVTTGSFEAQAALAWAALKVVSSQVGTPHTGKMQAICRMITGNQPKDLSGVAPELREFAVINVRDYLIENLERRSVTLYLIYKYKHRCEWFWSERLRQLSIDGLQGRKGERGLQIDLFDYLYDQGLDFHIEPWSPIGDVDLLGEGLTLDAKYIAHKDEAKEQLKKGFRQVLAYCKRHNRAVGYLVVFNACPLEIDLALTSDDGVPCFRYGGHTIYYVEVDLCHHEKSASKRPRPDGLSLSLDDLIKLIEPSPAQN